MKRIESTQNSLVKHWKKLVTTRKERDKSEEFLIEGFHLVEEALKKEGAIVALILRDGVEIPHGWSIEGVHIVEVNQAVANEISETEHSQGIFAQCRQPKHSEDEFASWKKVLMIDAVQDPGNVGTMIRTADAAGIDAVILGKGSADPYSPKTVRSAQGSHFNIPIVKGSLMEWVGRVKEAGIEVIGTGLQNAVNHSDVDPQTEFALIVGNEGSGVAPELLDQADKIVKIPMYGKAESLNVAVATGILLYAYVKR
ncbi:TrmH family RNA methyltransferase [Sporosarcina limicola]|uniref:TrmH family RNA methyltransferase n=1 Tax=Sporosarcina limicola TaxID=34101 RepID=A0A927R600_9BACL|nr:RNA methyltransferase [Sporosarcina limicola]MBE1554459.1 TrmH family RNA methyltransferase [Sporosarcina limicola]